MIRRIISGLLSILVVLALVPLTTLTVQAANDWDVSAGGDGNGGKVYLSDVVEHRWNEDVD